MSAASFIEETTTSIAGTSGNGAVTLSQVPGLPRFSHAFGTSARQVDYVIADTVNSKFEKGFGVVAGNVLARTVVHETWDGSAYVNNGSAVPLAFGSAPASGAIRIRIAPTPDAAWKPPQAMQTVSTRFGGYHPSAHLNAPNNGGSSSVSTGTEYYIPYLNPMRGAISAMAFRVQGAGAAGAQFKMGIYEVGPNGLPGACIVQSAAIAATTTGMMADASPAAWLVNPGPLRLSQEWYYIGLMVNDGSIQFQTFPVNGQGFQTQLSPIGHVDGYGWGGAVRKNAENSFAVGLPQGTPVSGGYTVMSAQNGPAQIFPFLKIANS